MDNLELVVAGLTVTEVLYFLTVIDVTEDSVIDAHFFDGTRDISLLNDVDLQEYYVTGSTGFIKVNRIYMGFEIVDVIIIISGITDDLEITLNFPYHANYIDKTETLKTWLEHHIPGKTKIFGYEPAIDEEQMLFKMP